MTNQDNMDNQTDSNPKNSDHHYSAPRNLLNKKALWYGLIPSAVAVAAIAGIIAGLPPGFADDGDMNGRDYRSGHHDEHHRSVKNNYRNKQDHNGRAHMQDLFEAIVDSNQDGVMDEQERSSFLTNLLADYDQDQSQGLTANEMQVAMRAIAFDYIDQDKDGTIQKSEFEAHELNHMGQIGMNKRTNKRFRYLLAKFDQDGDGQLSIPELDQLQSLINQRS
ncbi:MAG: EF-hand domain-containing protein [Alphaproteobacteria bacterium]